MSAHPCAAEGAEAGSGASSAAAGGKGNNGHIMKRSKKAMREAEAAAKREAAIDAGELPLEEDPASAASATGRRGADGLGSCEAPAQDADADSDDDSEELDLLSLAIMRLDSAASRRNAHSSRRSAPSLQRGPRQAQQPPQPPASANRSRQAVEQSDSQTLSHGRSQPQQAPLQQAQEMQQPLHCRDSDGGKRASLPQQTPQSQQAPPQQARQWQRPLQHPCISSSSQQQMPPPLEGPYVQAVLQRNPHTLKQQGQQRPSEHQAPQQPTHLSAPRLGTSAPGMCVLRSLCALLDLDPFSSQRVQCMHVKPTRT